ncbi:MAG: DUF1634 domain-containing protein [Desulfitobacteriaceae bacterium]
MNDEQDKMPRKKSSISMDDLISYSLRWGVVISIVPIACGLLLFFITGHSGYPETVFPTTVWQVLSGILLLKPFALIDFGLLLLIATPVFRVLVSIVGAVMEKDRAYVIINIYVLTVIIFSLIVGKAE